MKTFALAFYLGIAPLVFFSGFSCDQGPNDFPADTMLAFSLITPDTITVTPGEVACFHVSIANRGSSIATVKCIRRSNDLPDTSWVSSLCIAGRCFPGIVDSVQADILPARTDAFTVEIFTGTGPGTARVNVLIFNLADTAEKFERTFSCIRNQ